MRVRISELKFKIIYILCLLMPFHVLFFNIINAEFLTLWRDVFILLLLCLTFISGKLKSNPLSLFLFIRTILCVLFALIFHDSSMSPFIWINVLRIYIVPSLVAISLFYTTINLQIMKKICKLYVLTASAISTFGLFQLFFWGRPYLRLIGVPQASVLLADGTQRNIGVFESANVMGVYLLIALILVIQIDNLFKHAHFKNMNIFIIGVGIIFTYSMSTFLAMAIIGFVKVSTLNAHSVKAKRLLKALILLLIAAILFAIIVGLNPGILLTLQKQLGEKITDVILTLSGKNPISTSSAAIHFNGLVNGIHIISKNLNGLGFAKESFMVSDKVSGRMLIGTVESSFFTILFDFGLIVGGLYLAPYFWGLTKRNRCSDKRISEAFQYLSILFIVAYIFLPLIQSYELTFFYFMFTGLFCSYRKRGE